MIRVMRGRTTHRRRSGRIRFGRTLAAVALCLSGLVLAAAFLGITVQANALAREKAALQTDIAAASADQVTLKQHIEEQKTPDYVTQMARNLGLIGPNESLFAVQSDGQASDTSAKVANIPSRFARWTAFFFGSR